MPDASTIIFVSLFVLAGYVHFVENKLWADIVELIFYIIGTLIMAVALISETVVAGFRPVIWIVLIAGLWCIFFMSNTIKTKLDKKSYSKQ